ncbi:phosphatase PAP2 family protein [Salinimicrobium oceani]|uniref:Phosphatase PAP2 family protein n=1 Tax=Salinimicrobium oceani TaxID=2722702 RepID=A0ABX1CZU6_9FLAO|nr:phosphatase PAP2 family protein [Salinimicrobium oceani]NJW53332.1 phosphatase PAP2 family protein [Salinimicrobium oceani]
MVQITKKYINEFVEFFKRHVSREHPDFPFYLLIFLAFIVFVVGINGFVNLTEEVQGETIDHFDKRVTEFVTSFRTPELNNFFQFVTDLGDFYAYLFATITAGLFFLYKLKNKKFILQLVGVVILSFLVNLALKEAFDRARPTLEHMVVVKTLSYPSGHAMSAMSFYGFLIYLIFQIKMNRGLRIFLSLLFATLILLIGLSRIYLGVHFPSDVVGGFVAGLIWIAFCVFLFNILDLLRERRIRYTAQEEEENLETE